MSKTKLKKCPCCGGEAYDSEWNNGFHIYCLCGVRTELFKTKAKAASVWNNRLMEAENKRLREALQMIATEKDDHGQWLSVEQAAQITTS